MRAFHVDAAAFALDVPAKWLDNLLSHHHIPGVAGGRRGLRRRLRPEAILRIAVAATLSRQLGLTLPVALDVAGTLLRHGLLAGDFGLELRLDLPVLERHLADRLAQAAELAPPRRRGRPPRTRRHP